MTQIFIPHTVDKKVTKTKEFDLSLVDFYFLIVINNEFYQLVSIPWKHHQILYECMTQHGQIRISDGGNVR